MYPTLYHLLSDLVGIRLEALKLVNTFGLMVALAFAAAAKTLSLELARRTQLGELKPSLRAVETVRIPGPIDILWSAGIVFLFSFKLLGVALGQYSLDGGQDAQRYLLSGEGHLAGGLIVAALWGGFSFWQARKLREQESQTEKAKQAKPEMREITPAEHTMGITGAAAIGGIIGAKVFHWLETPGDIIEMFRNPSIGAIFSGLTIYGGLIAGALAVYRYSRKHNLSFGAICDSAAPGLMLAYGIGRLGCQLAGDGDWGIPSTSAPPSWLGFLPDWAWANDYPNNVLRLGVPMTEPGFAGYGTHLVPPVYPTPLYESVASFCFFLLLWSVRKQIRTPLVMFGIYLILNGFERFWIEKIRVNATYHFGDLEVTQAELISVGLFLAGWALLYRQLKRTPPAAPVKGTTP